MKSKINIPKRATAVTFCIYCCLFLFQANVHAQDSSAVAPPDSTVVAEVTEEVETPAKAKPVKNTFQSVWIIDNQSVMVPAKGTMEMDIMHRFGVITKGYKDLYGFFAPSNIRLAMSYAPINNLFVGFGITKDNMLWDLNAKYALIRQTKGKYPVSATYYTNLAYDTRKDEDETLFKYKSQRLTFFHQLIIARKISEKFSVQVAPGLSHQNAVNGYYTKNDTTGKEIFREMKYDHFSIALSGKYKISNVMSFLVNYDQPITTHAVHNPNPNLSFGLEVHTSSHAFQLFLGNYSALVPQHNNLYNNKSPFGYTASDGTKVKGGQFLIGFNITRLWNY